MYLNGCDYGKSFMDAVFRLYQSTGSHCYAYGFNSQNSNRVPINKTSADRLTHMDQCPYLIICMYLHVFEILQKYLKWKTEPDNNHDEGYSSKKAPFVNKSMKANNVFRRVWHWLRYEGDNMYCDLCINDKGSICDRKVSKLKSCALYLAALIQSCPWWKTKRRYPVMLYNNRFCRISGSSGHSCLKSIAIIEKCWETTHGSAFQECPCIR